MNKKSGVFHILLIVLLIIFIHNGINARTCDNIAQKSDGEFWDNIYNVDVKRVVAEIPDSNIRLYYIKEDKDFGMYRGFILQIKERKKYFGWENVSSTASYNPKLALADLDKDGEEELIIELCHGYGTGIFDGEVHVIRQESFDEIHVENPYIVLHKEKITLREFPEHFEVVLKGKKITLNKKSRLTPPYPKVGIGWGDGNTRYEVKNNKLLARVPLGISVISAGEFIVRYKYKDEILQKENVDLVDYENAD